MNHSLLVHLVLRKSDETPGLWQIALHEDFYHPDDIAALVVPPLIPVIKFLHTVGTVASNVNARVFGLFGTTMFTDALLVYALAQLYLQQNKIEDAVGMFKRQSDLARSEPELVNALTYQYVRTFFLYTVIMPDKSVAVPGFVCPDSVRAAVPRDGESAQCDRAEHRFCAGLSFSSNRGLK